MKSLSPYPAVLLLLLLASALAVSQETRGTILGTVTDTSGASIPGASVTITNNATGVASPARTNAEGAYVIPFLIPGTYNVQVEHEGFALLTVRE